MSLLSTSKSITRLSAVFANVDNNGIFSTLVPAGDCVYIYWTVIKFMQCWFICRFHFLHWIAYFILYRPVHRNVHNEQFYLYFLHLLPNYMTFWHAKHWLKFHKSPLSFHCPFVPNKRIKHVACRGHISTPPNQKLASSIKRLNITKISGITRKKAKTLQHARTLSRNLNEPFL